MNENTKYIPVVTIKILQLVIILLWRMYFMYYLPRFGISPTATPGMKYSSL